MSKDTITGLSIALITALSKWAVTYYTISRAAKKDAREQQEALERDARYLAIRVVCEIDPFIYACWDVSTDGGRPGRDGKYEPAAKLPAVSIPSGVDWRALDPYLMYRVLSLPNEIAAANKSIAAAMDHIATPPLFSSPCRADVGRRSARALPNSRTRGSRRGPGSPLQGCTRKRNAGRAPRLSNGRYRAQSGSEGTA